MKRNHPTVEAASTDARLAVNKIKEAKQAVPAIAIAFSISCISKIKQCDVSRVTKYSFIPIETTLLYKK